MGALTEDMRRVVEEQQLGFVATVCPDGAPTVSPRGTLAVWDDDTLVFADICSPGATHNLRSNPAIAVNVVDPLVRKGYRFRGTATVLVEGPGMQAALDFYARRGSTSAKQAIVMIKVESADALISPVYDQGQGEDEVAARWRGHFEELWRRRANP